MLLRVFFLGTTCSFLSVVMAIFGRVIVAMSLIRGANSNIVLADDFGSHNSGIILIDQVVPLFSYTGEQNMDLSDAYVSVLLLQKYESFCALTQPEEAKSFYKFNRSTILVITEQYFGMECDFHWGLNSGKYIDFWCATNQTILVLRHEYPGIMANSRFSNKEYYENSFQHCRLFSGNTVGSDAFLELAKNHSDLRVSLTMDENYALIVFNSFWCRLVFRGCFTVAYLVLACQSTMYLVVRYSNGNLNRIHRKVLMLNMITNGVFGNISAMGGNFLTSNVSSGVVMFLYSMLLGCSFAGDIWLTSMYSSLALRIQGTSRPQHLFNAERMAYGGLLLDLVWVFRWFMARGQ